jgi:hypothetical protein
LRMQSGGVLNKLIKTANPSSGLLNCIKDDNELPRAEY